MKKLFFAIGMLFVFFSYSQTTDKINAYQKLNYMNQMNSTDTLVVRDGSNILGYRLKSSLDQQLSLSGNEITIGGDGGNTIDLSALLGSNAVWGNITGTLSNQTDLNDIFIGKQDTLSSGINIRTINGLDILGEGNLIVTASGGEANDLTQSVTWDDIPDINVPSSAVKQHELILAITENQITDLNHTPASDGSETIVQGNTPITLSGSGTLGSPYQIGFNDANFFFADGTRLATGNFNMGGNDITNIGLLALTDNSANPNSANLTPNQLNFLNNIDGTNEDIFYIQPEANGNRGYSISTSTDNVSNGHRRKLTFPNVDSNYNGNVADNTVAVFHGRVGGNDGSSPTDFVTKQQLDAVGGGDPDQTLAEVLTEGSSTGGNDLLVSDNDVLRIGTGSDLQIIHNGSNTYFDNNTSQIVFRDADNGSEQDFIFDFNANTITAGGVVLGAGGGGTDDQTAAEVAVTPVGSVTSTDVQAAIAELDTDGIAYTDQEVATKDEASEIAFAPNGSISSNTVQAAIQEVRDEASGSSAGHAVRKYDVTASTLAVSNDNFIPPSGGDKSYTDFTGSGNKTATITSANITNSNMGVFRNRMSSGVVTIELSGGDFVGYGINSAGDNFALVASGDKLELEPGETATIFKLDGTNDFNIDTSGTPVASAVYPDNEYTEQSVVNADNYPASPTAPSGYGSLTDRFGEYRKMSISTANDGNTTHSIRVTKESNYANQYYGIEVDTQGWGLTVSQQYTVQAKVYITTGTNVELSVSNDTEANSRTNVNTTGQWITISQTFTPDSGNDCVITFWFDYGFENTAYQADMTELVIFLGT